MNPKPTAAVRLMDIAIRITALMMPGMIAIGGWMISQAMAHESRLDVMEDNRKVWIERFLEETAEIKGLLRDIDVRLRAIEVKVGE